MITPKSEFVVTVPEWENKHIIGYVPTKYFLSTDRLPKKYEGSKLRKIGLKKYYIDNVGRKIVKNKKSVGNPIYWTMNGQGFYNGKTPWAVRSVVVAYYHDYFIEYIKECLAETIPVFLEYRLSMHMDIYEVYSPKTPDISNMWILPKMFEDAVVKSKYLKDDSPEFRTRTSYEYVFVEDAVDRKLVITFKYKKI